MMRWERVTSQYDPAEDRIRLAGVGADGQTVVLWLTQRLLNRLVGHLCQGLEKRSAAVLQQPHSRAQTQPVHTHVMQSFAQQKAHAAHPVQRPVTPVADAPRWRVETVDVNQAAGGVQLTFMGVGGTEQAVLSLPTPALRQWLNIVFEQYRRAGWRVHAWPAWMEDAQVSSRACAAEVLLH